jgi:hypothetical protein
MCACGRESVCTEEEYGGCMGLRVCARVRESLWAVCECLVYMRVLIFIFYLIYNRTHTRAHTRLRIVFLDICLVFARLFSNRWIKAHLLMILLAMAQGVCVCVCVDVGHSVFVAYSRYACIVSSTGV